MVAGPAPADAKTEKVARRIIVANAGDSRSVLSYKGEAKPMSYDHKPGNKGEFGFLFERSQGDSNGDSFLFFERSLGNLKMEIRKLVSF